jgi:hypothetical protein
MIDPELKESLDRIEATANAAFQAADKTRKYMYWTGVITAVLFVLPLIGLAFAIPSFINTYTTELNSIGAY